MPRNPEKRLNDPNRSRRLGALKGPGKPVDKDRRGTLAYDISQQHIDAHFMAGDEGWLERKRKEPKTVVRVFLYQAISPERIPDDADPAELDFVRMILIKKGPGNSENQIMPVGGNIDDGETVDEATIREAVEETHLRAIPNSVVPFTTVQEYAFDHQTDEREKKTHKGRRTYYFQGHLLPEPHDQPYALDPKEDKIANFEHLTFAQVQQMFNTGEIVTEHGKGYVQDALNLDAEARAAYNVEAHEPDIIAIQHEALLRMRLGDAEKKMQILADLLHVPTYGEYDVPTAEHINLVHLQREVDQNIYAKLFSDDVMNKVADVIQQVDVMWREQIRKHNWDTPTIKGGLDRANMRYTIHHAAEHFDADTGAGVPTINLIFPLLMSNKLTSGRLRVIQENPQALKMLKVAQLLFNYNAANTNPDSIERSNREAMTRRELGIDAGAKLTFTAVRDWMYREGYLNGDNPQRVAALGKEVDAFFGGLQSEAKIDKPSIDQVNELQGASIDRVIELAFATDEDLPGSDIAYKRRVRFEAQRNILLRMMLHDAAAFSEEVIDRGTPDLDEIESALEAPDSIADYRKYRLELGGEEIDIDVGVRKRTKENKSLLRKLIVRDKEKVNEDLAGDVFAESIIFNDTAADFSIKKFDAPCRVEDAKGKVLTNYEAPAVVGAYMQALAAAAAAQNKRLEIVKFKGLPKPGEGFASSGVGGGAPVRMCKFYLRYTEPTGAVQQREVQMFVPNEILIKDEEHPIQYDETSKIIERDGKMYRWVPGQVDYDQKKADDEQYAVRRLFSTKALRSFMELLYPAEIYGDTIQPIYKSRVKG